MKKKLLAILLTLCMVLTLLPVGVLATEDAGQEEGSVPPTYVAEIGETPYESLSAAIQAVSQIEGKKATIKMLDNETLNATITINDGVDVTLDMNGKTLTSSGDYAIAVSGAAKLTIDGNGTIAFSGSRNKSRISITGDTSYTDGSKPSDANAVASTVTVKSGTITNSTGYPIALYGNGATLNVEGGKIESTYTNGTTDGDFAITGNGTRKTGEDDGGIILNISGGEIVSAQDCAIYLPCYNKTTITGGTIKGWCAIEIDSGDLSISGDAVLESTYSGDGTRKYKASGDGNYNFGAALAIVSKGNQGTTGYYGHMNIDISGGTFISPTYCAVDEYNLAHVQNNNNTNTGYLDSISITGGNFNGKTAAVVSDTQSDFITGGNFSSSVSEYVVDTLNAELIKSNSDVPYSYYATVDAAKAAAGPDDLVLDLDANTDFQIVGVGFQATKEKAEEKINAQIKALAPSSTTEISDCDENTLWAFVKLGETETDYTLTVTNGAGETVYKSTDTDGLSSASGLHIIYFSFEKETGSPALTDIISGTYTVTLSKGSTKTDAEIYLAQVSYDANGGTGAALPAPTYYTAGETIILPAVLTNSTGWSDGSAVYQGGKEYTVSTEVTFTAQWPVVTPVDPTVDTGAYALRFETNGGSAIDTFNVKAGQTVDLSAYVPTRTGYDFAGWYLDKALTQAVTEVKMDDHTTVYAAWTENGSAPRFVDVPADAYYAAAVDWAVANEITTGTTETTFSPNGACTRAQMVTFLWRLAGQPEPEATESPFVDVDPGAYYAKAVLWGVESGVVKGTSETTFSPTDHVTRGQAVTFLYRYAGQPEVSGDMPFGDVAESAYYYNAVLWAVGSGVTTGRSATVFDPQGDCARAEIVTFLYRYAG